MKFLAFLVDNEAIVSFKLFWQVCLSVAFIKPINFKYDFALYKITISYQIQNVEADKIVCKNAGYCLVYKYRYETIEKSS